MEFLQLMRWRFLVFGLVVIGVSVAASAQAATLYWVGGDGDSWNSAADWSTSDPGSCNDGGGDAGAAPTSSDVIVFDADCDSGMTIDANLDVSGIDIQSGYAGTITQNSTYTIDVGTSGWTQADGTFTGGDSAIEIDGTVNISGGAFTSTSSTLTWGGTSTDGYNVTIGSSATFSHNSGSVVFDGRNTTFDFDTSLTLNNLELRASSFNHYLALNSGDTLSVDGTLSLTTGRLNGQGILDANGTIVVDAGFGTNNFGDGQSGNILIDGTDDQSFTIPDGAKLPHLILNNANTTIDFADGASAGIAWGLDLQAGTFTAPSGTLYMGTAGNDFRGNDWINMSGGTFNHNNGTIDFGPSTLGEGNAGEEGVINVPSSITLNNVIFDVSTTQDSVIASGDTVIVEGTLTHSGGRLSGNIVQAQGDVVISDDAVGGTATLQFTGTNNQTYTDNGADEPDGDITINKSSGTVTLASNADWDATDQDVTITSGTLDLAGYDLSTGTFTVSAGATVQLEGGETISGTLAFDSAANAIYDGTGTYASGLVLGDAYNNITFNGSGGSWTLDAALDIGGDLAITAGTLVDGGNNITIEGSWSNSDTYTGTGTVTFDATSTAIITTGGVGDGNDFENMSINGSGATYSLSGSLDIDTNLTIIEGTLQTGKDETSDVTVDGTLNVQDGGTLVVRRSCTACNDLGDGNGNTGAGQTITAGTLTIDSGGSINANAQGFDPGAGPGDSGSRNGGSYGGVGGYGGVTLASTYGSMTNPTSLGSPGSGDATEAGGGAITLDITGTATVSGNLSANGGTAPSSSNRGAGSGGSLNITTDTLTGNGTISANGGAGDSQGGGGGGGRISLDGVSTDLFTGNLIVTGGTKGGNSGRGYAGTVYLNSAKRASLTIGGSGNLSSLRLGSDNISDYTFGAITIQSGGTLEVDGNPLMNSSNGGAATINLTTLDVQSGGTLTADELGFDDQQPSPGSSTGRTGGAYGGEAGTGSGGGATATTYGSITNPIYLGSSGGQSGGGAIIISASGAITVNGTISATGETAGTNGSGGSGGTVNISAASISGSGTVSANGSDGDNQGGGSGGGRIAVILSSGTDFGSTTIVSYGGAGGGALDAYSAAAGTVYLEDANDASGDGELIIDNNGTSTEAGTDTLISASVTDTAVGDVTIQNTGKLQMASDTALTVSGDCSDTVGNTLSTGTVTLDGTGHAIGGSAGTTFYNLTASPSEAATLTFPQGVTTTISNNTTLAGVDKNNRLSLRSSSDGSAATVAYSASGTRTVSYLDVKDNNNNSGTNITCETGCRNGGNNTGWIFPIQGIVYTDEGSTNIGLGKTVGISVNGAPATTGETDASGEFSVSSVTPDPDDVITVYLDNEDEQGVTISLTDGGSWTDLDIYQDRLIVRDETGSGVTNAALATADGNGDSDITDFYSISGSDITVADGKELLVWTGDTYAPGGTVTADDVDINGTFTMGANAVVVSGSWDATGGTFTSSGTVTMDSTTTETLTSNSNSFTNLTINGSAIHVNLQDALDVDTLLTIGSGSTLDANSYGMTLTGGSISNSGTLRLQGSETLTGFSNDTDSGTTAFDGTGSYSSLSGLASFNHLSFIGSGTWTLAEAIDANGNLTISAGTLDAHSSNNYGITVGGAWTNTAGTFSERSGTVTFDATAGTNTINEAGSFYSVVFNDGGGSATYELGSALDVDGNLTITGGTLDVSSSNYAITIAGTWTNNDGFTAQSGTVTFDGGDQTIAGSTTFYNFTKTESADDATDETLTFTAGTTQTITGTWTLDGRDSDDQINIVSSSPGTAWNVSPSGTRTLDFITITDSANTSGTTILCSNDCTNGGGNSGWAFPITVTVYTDEGSTTIGSGKTVAVAVDGGSKATAETNGSGVASFTTVAVSSGEVVTAWLDDETENGVAVSLTNGTSLGFNIYQNRLLLRHDTGSSITNANLATAAGSSDTDVDAIFTNSSGNITVTDGTELFIASGDTFAPGGELTLDDIDINGTFTMGADDVTVSGSWDTTDGSFTASNTVTFDAAAEETITSDGSCFNNITYAIESGGSITNTDALCINGTQTVQQAGFGESPEEDTTAPTISSISVTAAETKATIVWTTDESADSTVGYGTTSSLGSSSNDSTDTIQHAVTITGLTANTTYYYKVTSEDTSGNSASSETNTFTTVEEGTTSDTTAPTISGISASNVTDSGAVVSWTTNENTTTQMDYGESTSYNRGATSGSSSTLTSSHSVTLTGLAPSTTYHYRVVAIDAAGNITTSSDQTFTTSEAEEETDASEVFQEEDTSTDDEAPELVDNDAADETGNRVSSDAPAVVNITSTSAVVIWKTDKPSSSTVYYRPLGSSENPFKVGLASLVSDHTIPLLGLREATEYEYSVESTDNEGRRVRSKRYQFTTSLPEVSDIGAENVGARNAEFVYLTDSATQSIIELTNLATGETIVIEEDNVALEHRISLEDLDPNTEYSAVILVRGADGSVARSLAYIFETASDSEAPVISNIETRSAIVEGQQDIVQTIVTWTTNEPATGQVQYNEGISESEEYGFATDETPDPTTRHVIVLPELQPSTVYQYRVRSVDRGDNETTSESRILLTPQRRVSAFDLIIRNLEDTFGWARNLGL